MRGFRLVLTYDGTDFHGWQRQPGVRTVQGVLEEALAELLGARGPASIGAGRTDAGVHARGQVVSFAADTALPARAFAPGLNRRLPGDVRVRSAAEVEPGFDARRHATARRYAYRLLREDDVLWRRFAWWPGRVADPDRLTRAMRPIEGEHDCAAFMASGGGTSRPVCRVMRAAWSAWEGGWRLDVVADHFLYHMVRNLVGTALAAARTVDPAVTMAEVMASRDRRRAGVTVPARGLSLEQVFYGPGGSA